jgi:hypothetical protein
MLWAVASISVAVVLVKDLVVVIVIVVVVFVVVVFVVIVVAVAAVAVVVGAVVEAGQHLANAFHGRVLLGDDGGDFALREARAFAARPRGVAVRGALDADLEERVEASNEDARLVGQHEEVADRPQHAVEQDGEHEQLSRLVGGRDEEEAVAQLGAQLEPGADRHGDRHLRRADDRDGRQQREVACRAAAAVVERDVHNGV